jgi:hypothetical protein
MRIALNLIVVAALVAAWGCEASVQSVPTASDGNSAPPPPAPAPPAAGGATDDTAAPAAAPASKPAHAAPGAPAAPGAAAPSAAAPDASAKPEPAPAAPAAPGGAPAGATNDEKAAVGVGAKGRDYGGPGFVTTPIETLFRVEDRIAFEVQIPKAMSLYKAGHNNKGPKDQEEFMKVIIKENAVQLPELPPGDVYWYDTQTEELMVRHPVDK